MNQSGGGPCEKLGTIFGLVSKILWI